MGKVYCEGRLLWGRVDVAANPWRRLLGLMGRRGLAPGQGLLIRPCRQVHTCHMKFPLDVIFLNKGLTVLAVHTLEPGRVSPRVRDAACVLEVAAGDARALGLKPGDRLTLTEE